MIRPDNGKYPISQYFNDKCCRESYFKFGLTGHNGWDIACPIGTSLVAPHEGTITEIANDPTGYGLYLKIENSVEGSLLGHNKQILVSIGQHIDQGQNIVISGNSGNVTGPHSHWGYFRTPRDRNNGFNGYIDPTPYFDENVIIPPTIMEITDSTKIPGIENKEVQQIRSELLAKDARIKDLDSINTQQATMIKDLTNDLSSCLSKPTEAPKNALEAFKVLLHYIFK